MVFLIKNLLNSRRKLMILLIFAVTWLGFLSLEMVQFVFFEIL